MKRLQFLYIVLFGMFFLFLGKTIDAATGKSTLHFPDTRELGMGSAIVTNAHGVRPLVNNPASLSSLAGGLNMEFVGLQFDTNKEVVSKVSSVYSIAKDFTLQTSASSLSSLIKNVVPVQGVMNVSASPLVAVTFNTGFLGAVGAGIFINSKSLLNVTNEVNPKVHLESEHFVVVPVSYSRKVMGNIFVGATAKYVMKYSLYDKETGNSSITRRLSDVDKIVNENLWGMGLKKSRGIAYDLGLIYKTELLGFDLECGLLLKNVSGKLKGTMKNSDDTTVNFTEDLKKMTRLGAKVGVPLLGKIYVDYDFDDKGAFKDRLYLGIENTLLPMVSLRVGAHKGFWSSGASISLGLIRFDYGYYAYNFKESEILSDKTHEMHSFKITGGF